MAKNSEQAATVWDMSGGHVVALSNDDALSAWAERNGYTVTLTSAAVWFKDAAQAKEAGAVRCARINTKKNRVRGNWYIPRA